jgi:hypothetical protein
MDGKKRYKFMKIGVFYQSGHKLVACYMALQQLRKIYPNIPIALYEEGSNQLGPVAKKFNLTYKQVPQRGSNQKHFGRPVVGIESNLLWLGRIYEACTTTLKDVDWVILYEDDVWCKGLITREPKGDISGALGPVYNKPLYEYLKNRFGVTDHSRNVWSPSGSLENYGACGGTIFRRESFIQAYNKIDEISWEEIGKLDNRPLEWSDASLSFIFQHAGFTSTRWDDWEQYNAMNLGNHWDETFHTAPMDQQRNVAFIHGYKHFYNYTNDKVSFDDVNPITRGYLLIGLGRKYIDECFNLVLTLRKQEDNYPVTILIHESDIEYTQNRSLFDNIIFFKPDVDSDLWELCKTNFEKFCLYPRLHLNEYTPYDQTIIVDSDELCQYSTNDVWDIVSSKDFPIQMVGRKGDSNWHWGTINDVTQAYGKVVNHVHGGFVFMNKRDNRTKLFFNYLKEIVFKYDEYNCKKWYDGGMTDEILFAIAHSYFDNDPISFDEFPIITFNYGTDINPPSKLQTEGNQNKIMESPIPFVHMFDKIHGRQYNTLFRKILLK